MLKISYFVEDKDIEVFLEYFYGMCSENTRQIFLLFQIFIVVFLFLCSFGESLTTIFVGYIVSNICYFLFLKEILVSRVIQVSKEKILKKMSHRQKNIKVSEQEVIISSGEITETYDISVVRLVLFAERLIFMINNKLIFIIPENKITMEQIADIKDLVNSEVIKGA